MTLRYDKETDMLTIILGPDSAEPYEYEAGSFSVYVDDYGALVEISIKDFGEFVARALAAGANIDDLPVPNEGQTRPVWEDVESSMISAFKYDESTGTLDVMFNRSGVYRYSDVPYHIVKGLRAASSKGSYMRAMIIDVYDYEIVRR